MTESVCLAADKVTYDHISLKGALQSDLRMCTKEGAHFLWYKQFNYVFGSCKARLLFLDHLLYSRSLKI